MNQLYYIKLKPAVLQVKMGRSADTPYLVIGQPTPDKIEFINDNNEFDAVDKHNAYFAGLYEPYKQIMKPNTEPTEEKVKKGPFGRPLKGENNG